MPAGLTARWWVARDVLAVLAGFAVGGVLCGVLWQWWWTPPTGIVADHTWFPDLEGARAVFSGTALYTVVALVGGLLLGAAAAWFCYRLPLLTLVVVAMGAVLAAWLMYQTGTALAPPDPQLAAATAADDTELRGTLVVSGDSPFFAFPVGALVAVAAVFVGLTRGRIRR